MKFTVFPATFQALSVFELFTSTLGVGGHENKGLSGLAPLGL